MFNEQNVRDLLSDVYDPEMHVDIVSLGLIYNIDITDDSDVKILMTLTFPGCPFGPAIIEEMEEKLKTLEGIRNVIIDITFEPPWSPDKMDPDIKSALNL